MSILKKSSLVSLVIVILLVKIPVFNFASGKPLPADAAFDQVLYFPIKNESGSYLDRMKTLYNCLIGAYDLIQQPLIELDKDLEIVPLGAESWEISEDGLNWTFYLRKELKWSDGKSLTAYDYAFALQRAVQQGYDFGWYWKSLAGIKNWDQVEKGELPIQELGIKALDDYTLVITTEMPKPYLLSVLRQFYPVPRHAVEEHGDEYATRAETMVCNGPFKVIEWVRGSHLTCVQNPFYNGLWQPYLQKVILKYGTYDPETGFPAYLNDEIHRSELNAGQLAYAKQNLPEELHSWPMFRLYYLYFDAMEPPFSDPRVRQAFNHSLNREEMCSTVLKDLAIPEYSLLMTGFPGYDPTEVKKLSVYDPELARELLAEAGYPEGKGFPVLELWVRQANHFAAWQIPAANYMQAHFKEVLGIDILLRFVEAKTYTDALNNHAHNFFLLTYGFDYPDPSNFMDLFISGGRHAWFNSEYDRLVKEADSSLEWEKRIDHYRKAEEILTREVPAVFAFQALYNAVWKPYLKGEGIEPNQEGMISWGDISYKYVMSHIYITDH